MSDSKTQAKKAVLEEIMKLMDEREGEGLKSKSPKFAPVAEEAPLEEMAAEDELEEDAEMPSEPDDMDDEDRQRLKELYEKFA